MAQPTTRTLPSHLSSSSSSSSYPLKNSLRAATTTPSRTTLHLLPSLLFPFLLLLLLPTPTFSQPSPSPTHFLPARSLRTLASSSSAVSLHVNFTSAAPSGVISLVDCYRMERPACRSSASSSSSSSSSSSDDDPLALSQQERRRQVCPSMLLGEAEQQHQHCGLPVEDPLRVPRVIRQAVCLCIHCPGVMGEPCCKEHHVTIPVLHCDKNPEVEQPRTCTLSLQQISESCVCTRGKNRVAAST